MVSQSNIWLEKNNKEVNQMSGDINEKRFKIQKSKGFNSKKISYFWIIN